MKTLLSALELIQYTPVTKDFPPTKVCRLIEASEALWFNQCDLGDEFYEALVADLTEIPSNLKEWSALTTYALNDVTLYYGTPIKSLAANNTVDPCTDENHEAWEIVPKFQTECVNDFWGSIALAESYKIVADNLTIFTYELSGKGVTKYSEEFRQNTSGVITVDRGERTDYQRALYKQSDKFYEAMLLKLSKKYETCPILAKAVYVSETLCGTNCPPPAKNSRRIFYR